MVLEQQRTAALVALVGLLGLGCTTEHEGLGTSVIAADGGVVERGPAQTPQRPVKRDAGPAPVAADAGHTTPPVTSPPVIETPVATPDAGPAMPPALMTGPQPPAPMPPPAQLRPGVFVQIFDIDQPMERMPRLAPGQSPNVARYDDVIDFPARGNFGGLTDRFYVRVRGYLVVTTAGPHVLRLTSDDGARMQMELGGVWQRVLDLDGLHFAETRDVTVVLAPGMYAFAIEMFENEFFEQLTLSWRTPGSGAFEVVPTALLRVQADLSVATTPGKKRILAPGGGGEDDDDDKKDD